MHVSRGFVAAVRGRTILTNVSCFQQGRSRQGECYSTLITLQIAGEMGCDQIFRAWN